jgi:transposase-like protein
MGKRDGGYTLCGLVEMDVAFFTTETPEELRGKKLKAGAGSERKAKVAVMAETKESIAPKKGQKPTKVKYIKMVVVEDLKANTISQVVGESVVESSTVITDASSSHVHFKNMFTEHKSQVIKPEDIAKILPWVHIAISNSKSLFHSVHKGITQEYLQSYLSEFCYKFNRRYFGEGIFDRLLVAGSSYKSNFIHKTYRNVA